MSLSVKDPEKVDSFSKRYCSANKPSSIPQKLTKKQLDQVTLAVVNCLEGLNEPLETSKPFVISIHNNGIYIKEIRVTQDEYTALTTFIHASLKGSAEVENCNTEICLSYERYMVNVTQSSDLDKILAAATALEIIHNLKKE